MSIFKEIDSLRQYYDYMSRKSFSLDLASNAQLACRSLTAAIKVAAKQGASIAHVMCLIDQMVFHNTESSGMLPIFPQAELNHFHGEVLAAYLESSVRLNAACLPVSSKSAM